MSDDTPQEAPETGLTVTETEQVSLAHIRARELFQHVMGVAKVLYQSGLFPDCKNAAQAYVKVETGRELGLTPSTSMRMLHVVKGKVGLDADLMVALVKRARLGTFSFDETDTSCTAHGVRPETGEEYSATWNTERAKTAGLLSKDTYKQYLSVMLRHRATSELCRALWPDVLGGFYTPEELAGVQDVEFVEHTETRTEAIKQVLGVPPRDVTPDPDGVAETPQTAPSGESDVITDADIPM